MACGPRLRGGAAPGARELVSSGRVARELVSPGRVRSVTTA